MPYTVRFSRSGTSNDLEVLVSETHDCSTHTKNKRRSNLFLTFLYALFTFVIILTSTVLVIYFVTFDRYTLFSHRKIPMVSVSEVIISVSEGENMTCTDHGSCEELRRRIEQHDGMKFNFVIGSGMELFVGSGFTFHPDASNGTSALYIKVFVGGIPDGENSECCWCLNNVTNWPNYKHSLRRVNEIVQQATLCGKIKGNSTISVICGDSFKKCSEKLVSKWFHHTFFQHETNISSTEENNKTLYDHYDPNPEFGTILMKDFKLLTCEKPKHGRRTEKSKVITLKRLLPATCEPFRPVGRVRVDFERAAPLYYCDQEQPGMPCANLSRLLEKYHNASEYNFVLGTHHDLYVGLGYSCRSPPAPNDTMDTLRIKVLWAAERNSYRQLYRLYGVIKEGRQCGWIKSKYTLELDCDCGLADYKLFMRSLPKLRLARIMMRSRGMIYGSQKIDKTHRGKIVRGVYQWQMCDQPNVETNILPRKIDFLRNGTDLTNSTDVNGHVITGADFDWYTGTIEDYVYSYYFQVSDISSYENYYDYLG